MKSARLLPLLVLSAGMSEFALGAGSAETSGWFCSYRSGGTDRIAHWQKRSGEIVDTDYGDEHGPLNGFHLFPWKIMEENDWFLLGYQHFTFDAGTAITSSLVINKTQKRYFASEIIARGDGAAIIGQSEFGACSQSGK